MKIDIILAGVGGQGILSIATIIGKAALDENLYIKQAEVHGMSQRGGDVQSNLRVSDKPISSDLIPYGKADLILSMEPMEALRYINYLSPKGWIITNSTPFINIDNYPDEQAVKNTLDKMKNVIYFDMDAMAKDCGSPRSSNMVLLGAASPFLEMDANLFNNAIAAVFERKGEKIVDQNIAAFKAGRDYVLTHLKDKNYAPAFK